MSFSRGIAVRLHWGQAEARRRVMNARLRRAGHTLEAGVKIDPRSEISAPTTIGRSTGINGPATIKGMAPVSIGRYAAIGSGFTVITSGHRLDRAAIQLSMHDRFGWSSMIADAEPVRVGHATWIGDGVTILPGVKVGNGAVLAAGSIVKADVPPFSIAAGVPARFIRTRFREDTIELLEELSWWDWDLAKIERNRVFFEADLSEVSPPDVRQLIVP